MDNIKENYELMFTAYPDIVKHYSTKRNAWNWYKSCL